MKVALLYNLNRNDTIEEMDFDRRTTIDALCGALWPIHSVLSLECTRDIVTWLSSLIQYKPDLVFNFAAGFPSVSRQGFYPALFEQLGIAYTGSDAATMLVCLNKALAKKIAADAGVQVPWGFVIEDARQIDRLDLRKARWPLLVKPNGETWGLGIDRKSIVNSPAELVERVAEITEKFGGITLVEEFVPRGMDVSMTYIEGLAAEVFEPVVYEYPVDEPVFSYALKTRSYTESILTFPSSFSPFVLDDIHQQMRRVIMALDIRTYARADFRISPEGQVFFLEIDPRPELLPHRSDFFAPLLRAGFSYDGVVRHVVEYAAQTYRKRATLLGLRTGRFSVAETLEHT